VLAKLFSLQKRLNNISRQEHRRGSVVPGGPFAVAVVYLIVVIPLLVVALSETSSPSVRSSRPAISPSPVPRVSASPRLRVTASQLPRVPPAASPHAEYLWYEAENMRGFATTPRGEPIQNPSWLNLPRIKAPGWGINGPGVSAEWSQGGESEWNSAAASADETSASIYQDVEVPRAGDYTVWVRYADWANKTESFVVRIIQEEDRMAFRHEFGAKDVIDVHDEVSMYWGWSFAWDGAVAKLKKGPARISIEIEKAAEARRHVDCLLVTNDLAYIPEGRRKPDF
jgi:hypothetical protein